MLSDLFFEPGQDVLIDLLLVGLVEHLMPSAGIEAHKHIVQSRLAEGFVGFRDALSVLAHRVRVAGHEVNGFFLIHGVDVLLICDELDAAHQELVALFEVVEVRKFADIFCDQLQELFTETTGLYTHF